MQKSLFLSLSYQRVNMWQHATLISSVEVVTVEILFKLVVKNNHTACGYLI